MDRSAFGDGLRDSLPAVPPNIPFGMLFGATAVAVGIDPVQATALSAFTFAATAQLAAVDLLADGAALPVVLATVLVINLRYVVYSASIAPEVRHLSARWRAAIAYPLFDITYAMAMARYLDGDADPDELAEPGAAPAASDADAAADPDDGHRGWYYAGVALPFVGSFIVATAAGALIGRTLGAGLQLDFAIPLIFLSLLVPTIDGRPAIVAAVVAAGLAVLGAGLPFNLGLLVGLLAGIAAGAITDRGVGA